ncbi:MAG: glycine/sarcosine/betaine reductase component B subunit, partial [Cohaesibacter sp.]|nr:glycine/sarcosine/betaine reductase component B subunit [Cohaesibacter sp.]
MDHVYHGEELERVREARTSYSGNLLTDRQFNDVMAVTGIIERRMKETGTFKDCLGDFSNALARTERFDTAKANTIIRDLFRARTGMSMNKMREGLIANERKLLTAENPSLAGQKQDALMAVKLAGQMVKEGSKMTFHRAISYEAAQMATKLNVTDAGVKRFMADTFKESQGKELRDWGRDLDEKYYRPQIEAEKSQRTAERNQSRSQQMS